MIVESNIGNTIMRVIGTIIIVPGLIYLNDKYNMTLYDTALYMISLLFCYMRWCY